MSLFSPTKCLFPCFPITLFLFQFRAFDIYDKHGDSLKLTTCFRDVNGVHNGLLQLRVARRIPARTLSSEYFRLIMHTIVLAYSTPQDSCAFILDKVTLWSLSARLLLSFSCFNNVEYHPSRLGLNLPGSFVLLRSSSQTRKKTSMRR